MVAHRPRRFEGPHPALVDAAAAVRRRCRRGRPLDDRRRRDVAHWLGCDRRPADQLSRHRSSGHGAVPGWAHRGNRPAGRVRLGGGAAPGAAHRFLRRVPRWNGRSGCGGDGAHRRRRRIARRPHDRRHRPRALPAAAHVAVRRRPVPRSVAKAKLRFDVVGGRRRRCWCGALEGATSGDRRSDTSGGVSPLDRRRDRLVASVATGAGGPVAGHFSTGSIRHSLAAEHEEGRRRSSTTTT